MLKFSSLVILLSKLLTKIEDKFFVQKLHRKILDLMFAFIEKRTDTSHNIDNLNLINSINNLLDYLEYLEHDSKSNATPLFVAQRNLLKFKLFIFKQNKTKKPKRTSNILGASDVVNFFPSLTSGAPISKPALKPEITRLVPLKSDSNKEKIFDFVKRSSDLRTKDIMNKFNALSGRTVKRNLKELTDQGFLRKKTSGGATYYLAADLN